MKDAKELEAKILEKIPEEVKLSCQVIAGYLTIRPEGWLGSEGFSKVQQVIKEFNGEYVSAGRLSHFRILLEPKNDELVEWYMKQSKTLTASLVLTLNCKVENANELENLLNVLKKHVERKK